MWVRPILTMSFHSCAFASIASRSAVTAGITRCFTSTAAAMHMADGKGRSTMRHVNVIVGVNRCLAAERRACELAAPVGDHLVDVHVELGAAAGHPDMQRKVVVMLAAEYLLAGLDNQVAAFVVDPLPSWLAMAAAFFKMA